ncbi:MAG: YggS family pyridoxal phosphate-dependent enzyme [Gammaproteobacteria bacterium]|nr:YggS family pyridoxal phosphate-dependent enzyme [Gammaproteobacteria bacterium]
MGIAENLEQVRQRLAQAQREYGRDAESVRLLAVSKTKPVQALQTAIDSGQRAFGENYLQEALDKIEYFAGTELEWHFIGPIQSNKTRAIAEHFDWVHSVDRLKIARRLSEQRPPGCAPLNLCIQVNVDDESSKSGCRLEALPELVAAINELPNIRLRGLMAIPRPSDTESEQRKPFRQLAEALAQLRQSGYELDTLSMGMSADLEAAVAEGSTLVRIGTDIFGARDKPATG